MSTVGVNTNGLRCMHALFCEECRLEPDGTSTLVSLFTRLSTPQLPLSRPLCFVCFLEREVEPGGRTGPESIDVTLRILSPFGVTVHTSSREAPFVPHVPGKTRCGLSIPVSRMIFDEYGDYAFELYVGEEYLHAETLTIKPDKAWGVEIQRPPPPGGWNS